MRWWIQTRGRHVDYPQGVLSLEGSGGQLPSWWVALWGAFRDVSTPEEPMLLVETDRHGWRLYATAMGTGRRDSKGRNIRASLIAAGERGEANTLGLLILAWFDGRLAAYLREQLPEAVIEPWLNDNRAPPEAADLIEALVWDLPEPELGAVPSLPRGVWGGSAESLSCQQGVAAQAMRATRDRRHGLFCWLNLLEHPEDARDLTALREADVAVLLLEGEAAEDLGAEFAALSRGGGAQGPPNPPSAGLPQRGGEAGPPAIRSRPGLIASLLALLAGLASAVRSVIGSDRD